jgi:aminomethyltransferase
MSAALQDQATLQRTPLYALHRELGACMAPFAGYDMPIRYPSGVLKEHLHTRRAAGLFDISHMGQIALRPKSADLASLARALELLMPIDVVGLAPGRQRYAFFTNASGGIIDDFMIAHRGDHFFLVVNASRTRTDLQHLQAEKLEQICSIEPLTDRALLAVQGPAAESVLSRLAGPLADMRFMAIAEIVVAGCHCVVARSGYTGEDGFEISVSAGEAETLARALLAHPEIAFVGLGARDSLRIESGLCLYGADIDATTTPVEAALEWAIPRVRRRGGERAGSFPGADIILGELDGGPRRRRVGLRPQQPIPVRGGAVLFGTEPDAKPDAKPIGVVTSGLYGPSVAAPVAMGYVGTEHAQSRTPLFARVREHLVPVDVTALPFVPHRYKR